MDFNNTEVWGFEHAIRGMRNPKNSWDKSDSFFDIVDVDYLCEDSEVADKWIETYHPELKWSEEFSDEGWKFADIYSNQLLQNGIIKSNQDHSLAEVAFIGPNDMKLAQTLIKAGPEHRKFLRQIFVSVDITAPLYWY